METLGAAPPLGACGFFQISISSCFCYVMKQLEMTMVGQSGGRRYASTGPKRSVDILGEIEEWTFLGIILKSGHFEN